MPYGEPLLTKQNVYHRSSYLNLGQVRPTSTLDIGLHHGGNIVGLYQVY